jgi:hypothetical protein
MKHWSLAFGLWSLVLEQDIVCCFAPEGRDVYGLAVLIFIPKLCRSAIAFCLARQRFRCQVSLLTERDLRACAPSYKHLAPMERKAQ